ncbi:survival protein SurA precursor [Buchnera aphidicola str. Ak (Acyrthosiphon kondoi)]|uniref:Chaperone SurA n=1 Tax=Buchnera aphidicola str. Ak (Acyrthosiphon kondoi) TaxID=1005090 RepID=G2LML2_9GAMM|nr:peptidylprolyl isomerase [Buchnera aphidicola]AEO08500.1 survival protein SurA precursor [Buchnera aphidicola str. Ak (Acyrthosiphon kondoi)]
MKVLIFIFFYIFTGIFCVLAKENQIDNIIAVVNDQVILNSDVNEMLFFLKKERRNFKIPLRSNFLKDKVIEKLIVNSLILQEANRMNVRITQEQIDTVIENIASKKNININEFKKNILFHDLNNHFYYDNYMKNIERLLKIRIIQDYELRKRINISEQEVSVVFKNIMKNNKKFKRINLSYILLPFAKKDSQNTIRNKQKIVEDIVNKIKKGYSFEQFLLDSKKNKSIFVSKKMFWMRFLDIQNCFVETLNIFKKGQIIGPLLGDKGFYILKINDIDKNRENITTEFYMQHCLIKPSIIQTDIESKRNIFNIYENIKKGVYSFDDAVKNLSHDFYSSNKKGDLGWVSKKSFSFDLDKEFLYLNKNEISKPIKSNFGWHIFKLLDKRQVDEFYNFKKKQAYNILLNKKMILEKHNWIEELKKIAYIKIIRS